MIPQYCQAFGGGAVTTCFNNLIGLSQLGFEHPTFRLRGEHSNPLRHHRGCVCLDTCICKDNSDQF